MNLHYFVSVTVPLSSSRSDNTWCYLLLFLVLGRLFTVIFRPLRLDSKIKGRGNLGGLGSMHLIYSKDYSINTFHSSTSWLSFPILSLHLPSWRLTARSPCSSSLLLPLLGCRNYFPVFLIVLLLLILLIVLLISLKVSRRINSKRSKDSCRCVWPAQKLGDHRISWSSFESQLGAFESNVM